ncbi:MAG: phosphoribosylamine--glycine ligase [Acidimicrobiales bacterium]|nr:phosphoribosylamine--glycine ligase [Acidimicrobiales bacterium]
MKSTICVVGSGAREHALALTLAKSCEKVIVTPGNPGMTANLDARDGSPATEFGTIDITDLPPEAIEASLYVIGPEVPLVEGLADKLRSLGKKVVGPGADGAKLEGSKIWMKEILTKSGVPTAKFGVFDEFERARRYLKEMKGPWVIKTDGLAAGKGVLVTDSLAHAIDDVRSKLSGESFGAAGTKVVIEEYMEGLELSLMVLTDGKTLAPMSPARDAKRVFDGDEGANTGGMGAFSPVPLQSGESIDKLVDDAMERAVEPLLGRLIKDGIDYRGVLYAGLMLTEEGPKVVEYNIRFGDPETQAVLPRLEGDLVSLLDQVATGHLSTEPRFSPKRCVNVVLSAPGYPESPKLGEPIEINREKVGKSQVFFAGVTQREDGALLTSGGRVMSVSALGDNLIEARENAYRSIEGIEFEGMHFRRDIGLMAVELESTNESA